MMPQPGKSETRKAMREMRRDMSAVEKSAADVAICERLSARISAMPRGTALAVYLASPAEISIDKVIDEALRSGMKVYAPRWNGETYELAALHGINSPFVRIGPMNIREPAEAEIADAQDIDLWIVPGLAFTRDGGRLGYGGGWYDRLMANASPDSVRIGVAYEFQILDKLPAEPHDIPLTEVVSTC